MAMTLLPYGLKGMIYRSPMPFSRYDLAGDLYREFEACEIDAVVMLVSDEEARECSGRSLREMYQKDNLRVMQMEIADFNVPALAHLRQNVQRVKELAEQGQNIAIHCHAGLGRTGLFAACLEREIHRSSGEDAITWVRKFIPGAVESDVQKTLVNNYLNH